MTDSIKSWIEERRAIHSAAPGEAWSNYGTPPFEVYDSTKYADGDMGEMLAETRALKVSHAITDAHNMFPRALDALNKVLELHRKERHEYGGWMCTQCTRNHPVPYPCATVQAIEGAINGERG